MKGLAGKRVVVTGGSSGIGEATVRRFRDEGAHVTSMALDGEIECDVADAEQVAAAFEQLGDIDVLVANAGISIRAPFLEIREEDWRRVLDVNLTGVFHCAQQAARRMDEGVILMTASTNGLAGHEN
jgi:meso-butanediol dehydrogenase / (S,S)-butanediol dehydrogenase / diacetyl reductase